MADAEAIARHISSATAVAPVSSQSVKAIFGNQNWSTQVTGSDNGYFKVSNRSIRSGRIFTESEIRSGGAVCVIGETVRKKLFGGQGVSESGSGSRSWPARWLGFSKKKARARWGWIRMIWW